MIRVPCLRVPQKFGDAAPLSGHCLFRGVGMMGVFVQLNEGRLKGRKPQYPVGYVIEESGCWTWVGSKNPDGYGKWKRDGHFMAHRWMYAHFKGPIPKGLKLDHLCRYTLCVNPDHLEPVTQRENLMRGKTIIAKCAQATACPQGHAYDETNTAWYEGRRSCRQCSRARNRGQYQKRKARTLLGGTTP